MQSNQQRVLQAAREPCGAARSHVEGVDLPSAWHTHQEAQSLLKYTSPEETVNGCLLLSAIIPTNNLHVCYMYCSYFIGSAVKGVQLMAHYEHLASVFAQLVATVYNDLGVKQNAADFLRYALYTIERLVCLLWLLNSHVECAGSEISRVEPGELEHDAASRSAYSSFLVELSILAPAAILPHVHLLEKFLESDVCFFLRDFLN